MNPRAKRLLGPALLLAAWSACSKTTAPPPGPPPRTVSVSPSSASLWVADTLHLTAEVRDDTGAVDSAAAVVWSNTANDVVQLAVLLGDSKKATAYARAAGVATVAATSGAASGKAEFTVSALALVVEGYPNGIPEMFRVLLPAGVPERILAPGMVAMDPTPSPDGTQIAFVVANYNDTTGDIYVVNRDGTGLRNLTDDEPLDDAPAWSPDGTRIAYRSYTAGYLGDIWVRYADGSSPVNLTPKAGAAVLDNHRPSWSPDGGAIAYASTGGGDWGIWRMNHDGSAKTQLTFTPDFDTEPSWSRDGDWIAFRRSDPTLGSDIVIMPASGGQEDRLILAGEQRQPQWSPDGRRIVFTQQADLSAPAEIRSCRPDGTDVVEHTFAGTWAPAHQPGWLRLP